MERAVGEPVEAVGDRSPGKVEEWGDLAEATAEVDVLHVEEEPLVEEADPFEGFGTDHETTSGEVGNLQGEIPGEGGHPVPPLPCGEEGSKGGGDEAAEEEVRRRGKELHQLLVFPVRAEHSGHEGASVRMLQKEIGKGFQKVGAEGDVRVEDEKAGALTPVTAEEFVVPEAVPPVREPYHLRLGEKVPNPFNCAVQGAVVGDDHPNPFRKERRTAKASEKLSDDLFAVVGHHGDGQERVHLPPPKHSV